MYSRQTTSESTRDNHNNSEFTHTDTPRNNIMSFQDVGRSQRKPANAALSSSSNNSNHRVPDTWMGGSSSTSSGSIGQISESLTQYQVWSCCNAREECACCGWKEISDATGKLLTRRRVRACSFATLVPPPEIVIVSSPYSFPSYFYAHTPLGALHPLLHSHIAQCWYFGKDCSTTLIDSGKSRQ